MIYPKIKKFEDRVEVIGFYVLECNKNKTKSNISCWWGNSTRVESHVGLKVNV